MNNANNNFGTHPVSPEQSDGRDSDDIIMIQETLDSADDQPATDHFTDVPPPQHVSHSQQMNPVRTVHHHRPHTPPQSHPHHQPSMRIHAHIPVAVPMLTEEFALNDGGDNGLLDVLYRTLSRVKDIRLSVVVGVIFIIVTLFPLHGYIERFLHESISRNSFFPIVTQALTAALAVLVVRNWDSQKLPPQGGYRLPLQ